MSAWRSVARCRRKKGLTVAAAQALYEEFEDGQILELVKREI